MKHLALFVVGAAFLRPTRCKQNSRIFFVVPSRSFLQMLAKKRLWAEVPMIFGDFNFDILLTVLDDFNFLWSLFFGGVTSYKGCLYTK